MEVYHENVANTPKSSVTAAKNKRSGAKKLGLSARKTNVAYVPSPDVTKRVFHKLLPQTPKTAEKVVTTPASTKTAALNATSPTTRITSLLSQSKDPPSLIKANLFDEIVQDTEDGLDFFSPISVHSCSPYSVSHVSSVQSVNSVQYSTLNKSVNSKSSSARTIRRTPEQKKASKEKIKEKIFSFGEKLRSFEKKYSKAISQHEEVDRIIEEEEEAFEQQRLAILEAAKAKKKSLAKAKKAEQKKLRKQKQRDANRPSTEQFEIRTRKFFEAAYLRREGERFMTTGKLRRSELSFTQALSALAAVPDIVFKQDDECQVLKSQLERLLDTAKSKIDEQDQGETEEADARTKRVEREVGEIRDQFIKSVRLQAREALEELNDLDSVFSGLMLDAKVSKAVKEEDSRRKKERKEKKERRARRKQSSQPGHQGTNTASADISVCSSSTIPMFSESAALGSDLDLQFTSRESSVLDAIGF